LFAARERDSADDEVRGAHDPERRLGPWTRLGNCRERQREQSDREDPRHASKYAAGLPTMHEFVSI